MSVAAPPPKTREYEFTRQDFDEVRKLIYRHAGISLSAGKQDLVYSRLARRLRERGITRFRDYLDALETSDGDEREAFVNALTTNLTAFYREAHHFPLLAEHLARRWDETREPMTVWCCAASTGEEPYTLAMTAIETFGDRPPVRILATDIDTAVLAKAEAGVYEADRLEPVSPERARRFFLRGTGSRDGYVKVRPALRALVAFRRLNLLDRQWPIYGPFDAIVCRNVMIYFDRDVQRRVLVRFPPLMRPDALLFAGHSESFAHTADLFRLRGKTVYELATGPRRQP